MYGFTQCHMIGVIVCVHTCLCCNYVQCSSILIRHSYTPYSRAFQWLLHVTCKLLACHFTCDWNDMPMHENNIWANLVNVGLVTNINKNLKTLVEIKIFIQFVRASINILMCNTQNFSSDSTSTCMQMLSLNWAVR